MRGRRTQAWALQLAMLPDLRPGMALCALDFRRLFGAAQRPVGAAAGRSFASVAPINANSIKVTRAAIPKAKPPFDTSLPFGTKFSDHMLEIDWDIETGAAPCPDACVLRHVASA